MPAAPTNPDSALSRGLKLVEHFLQTDRPVRFTELRELLPGIPDSTLSRLLRTLEENGCIAPVAKSGYTAGPRIAEWRRLAADSGKADWSRRVEQAVHELARLTNESAAYAELRDDRLAVAVSVTVPGAVSVIGPGSTLHFEADHAAALAVLNSLPPPQRQRLIEGRYSRIPDSFAYHEGIRNFKQDDIIFLDRSRERPGICRIAVPVETPVRHGALFLCLTLDRAAEAQGALVDQLLRQRNALLPSP